MKFKRISSSSMFAQNVNKLMLFLKFLFMVLFFVEMDTPLSTIAYVEFLLVF